MSTYFDTDHGVAPGPADASTAGSPGRPAGSAQDLAHRRVASVRCFYAAAIALAVSAFLPWADVLGVVGVHPTGFEVVYLLALAGVYAGGAYLVRNAHVTRVLLFGAWIVNVWMVLNVLGIFGALGKGGGFVTPGAGLWLATGGVLAGIVAVVQLHRSRARVAAAAHTPGPGTGQRG